MESYTFVVQLPFKGRTNYMMDFDENKALIENFAILVRASQSEESGEEIPIEITTANGQTAEVQWTFALMGEDGDEMLLAPHLSMEEQGVLPGAEIIVEDESNVGAPVSHDRFRDDCIKLLKFVRANEEHLSIAKQTRRQIDIKVNGVRTIIGIKSDGAPLYGDDHMLRILVPADYPFQGPTLVPLSPVFHPNIAVCSDTPSVCYTEGYIPNGDDTFSYMISQWLRMVQYRHKGWNLQEPHRNQNEDASLWLEKVLEEHKDFVPVKPAVHFRWS